MTENELIGELLKTKEETLGLFRLSESELEKSYAPGKWSVRYLLHHLGDTESVLFERIRRTISEHRPRIMGFDQDAWARRLDYQDRPLSLSRDLYTASRDGIIHYVSLHYVKNGQREFLHSEAGVRTLAQEMEKAATHNRHHLEQIRRALSR